MHCLILRVPARAGGISHRMYAANSMGCTKGSRMLRAAGVFEKRWTQTYSTDERQALCETWGCSSAGRAPALQAGGRQFDSVHLHQLPRRHFAYAVRRIQREDLLNEDRAKGKVTTESR